MLKDATDNITNSEVESMSKTRTPPIVYSLSQELHENFSELAVLEKKINLVGDLLAKVNDQVLISKLEKEKEGFEAKKINLSILIKKLEYINGSIKDFTLFFIFLRRFYTLIIQKENFEEKGKNISLKLINNLKTEEKSLYNEFIDGDCFSKVFQALSFESYQSYFEEYARNFFENIQSSSDPYINSLLALKAVFYECTYFNTDNFYLTNLKFFLSQHIPINVSLPTSNHELVALRCFFFYELLLEYLKLRPVKTNLYYLKKSINLELNVVNYKSINKETLYELHTAQEVLIKLEKKLNIFLEKKSETNEADVNNALIFYKNIEIEINLINKKNQYLIDKKYINLTKMRQLLALIVDEKHVSKFLEIFNSKLGNDFLFNKIEKPDNQINKEALNQLFHTLCRDDFYKPLNEEVHLFINEAIDIYSKDPPSLLDNIGLEDLIEFSFYYTFTLLYPEFNARLKRFNNKLLYTEMITFNIFINIKLTALEILEKKIDYAIGDFFGKSFRNKTEHGLCKKNISEEVKLYLEVIQDTKQVLADTQALEFTLTPKLESSLAPMPEKNLFINLLNSLENKKKTGLLTLQKIEKNEYINKIKSQKISKANEAYSKKDSEIKFFSKVLGCLSENLSESLKTIKENLYDINQCYEKIYSSKEKISSSIQMLSSSLGSCKNSKETLSLPKLLKKSEDLVKNTLITGEDHQENLDKIQELLNSTSSFGLINFFIEQFNLINDKYNACNYKANEILKDLSTFTENHKKFGELKTEEKEYKIIKKILDDDYESLKKQSKSLKKLISLFKCDTDARLIPLYKKIKDKNDEYQATYYLLKEKRTKLLCIIKKKSENDDKKVTLLTRQGGVRNRFALMNEAGTSLCKDIAEGGSLDPIRNEHAADAEQSRFNDNRTNLSKHNGFFAQTLLPIKEEDAEKIPAKNLSEKRPEEFIPSTEKSLRSQGMHADSSTEHHLLTQIVGSTDKCNKLKTCLEGEYTKKEQAKAHLKRLIPENKYNFFMERIDPFNVSISTPAITETNVDSNPATVQADAVEANNTYPQFDSSSATCSYIPEVAFYPPVVVDTYRLESSVVVNTYRLESRTVYPS